MTVSLAFLALVTVPAFLAAWWDLSTMRIPNKLVLVFLGIFVATAPFLVGLSETGLRLAIGAGALAFGFVLNMAGVMGAGDAKLIAATAPFIDPRVDAIFTFVQLIVFLGVAGLIAHRLIARSPRLRALAPNWRSWQTRDHFPYGTAIATALWVALALQHAQA